LALSLFLTNTMTTIIIARVKKIIEEMNTAINATVTGNCEPCTAIISVEVSENKTGIGGL